MVRVVSMLKVVGIIVAVLAVIGAIVGGYMWVALGQQRAVSKALQNDMSGIVQDVAATARIDRSVQLLQYTEEVLAQSVRQYASTGEQRWKDRYEATRPRFTAALEPMRNVDDAGAQTGVAEMERQGTRLAVMLDGAIELTDEGQQEAALGVLDGEQYMQEKQAFERGVQRYAGRREGSIGGLLSAYEARSAQAAGTVREITYAAAGIIGFALVAVPLLGYALLRSRALARKRFAEHVAEYAAGTRNEITPPPERSMEEIARQLHVINSRAQAENADESEGDVDVLWHAIARLQQGETHDLERLAERKDACGRCAGAIITILRDREKYIGDAARFKRLMKTYLTSNKEPEQFGNGAVVTRVSHERARQTAGAQDDTRM